MKLAEPEQAPLVSVIVPTFNRARLLGRAMASVLGQSYRNLELIVVDDCSKDETEQVVCGFADARVRYVKLAQNGGAAVARNEGVRQARGALLAFQDDDDIWLVQKLEKQVSALLAAPPETGWCLCGYLRLVDGKCKYYGGDFYWRELDYSRGMGDGGPEWYLIATPTWLVRRDALQRAGSFDQRTSPWEDWELGLRLSETCGRTFVDEPLYVQDHAMGGGLMNAERKKAAAFRVIMEKHGHRWAGNREVLTRHYYIIGRIESMNEAAPGAGRAMLFKALALSPLKAKIWAAIALSYLPQGFSRGLTARIRGFRLALKR